MSNLRKWVIASSFFRGTTGGWLTCSPGAKLRRPNLQILLVSKKPKNYMRKEPLQPSLTKWLVRVIPTLPKNNPTRNRGNACTDSVTMTTLPTCECCASCCRHPFHRLKIEIIGRPLAMLGSPIDESPGALFIPEPTPRTAVLLQG